MTNKEVIEYLKEIKSFDVEIPNDYQKEALEMAISALSENKGEWIVFNGGYICSKCRENGKIKVKNVASHYCPDCGADMRGE